jgi:hypothetical protein
VLRHRRCGYSVGLGSVDQIPILRSFIRSRSRFGSRFRFIGGRIVLVLSDTNGTVLNFFV